MGLTEQQKVFAEQHHNLIYAFLYRNHLDIEEFYDLAAIGFVKAVKDYCRAKKLKKYAFSTIAWRSMQFEINNEKRCERSKKRQRVHYPDHYSKHLEGSSIFLDQVFQDVRAEEDMDEMLLHLDLRILLAQTQYAILMERIAGYTYCQIARLHSITVGAVSYFLKRIRRIIKTYMEPV